MPSANDIDAAIAAAEAETGAERAGARGLLCAPPVSRRAGRLWGSDEDKFISENLGKMSEEAIAVALNRSQQSVHLRAFRNLHLTAPSKDPRVLTAEQVSWGLGMGCGKSVHRLIDDGILPGRRLPGRMSASTEVCRVVDRAALLRWMIAPMNWIYFAPERVGILRLQGKRGLGEVYDFEFWGDARDLVLKARASWKDEWLTPGQAAAAIGYKNAMTGRHSINTAIHRGTLKAVRWGNWRIRRSDLPAPGMTINVSGTIVPKIKPRYICPRGMTRHVNHSTCMKLRFCREMAAGKRGA